MSLYIFCMIFLNFKFYFKLKLRIYYIQSINSPNGRCSIEKWEMGHPPLFHDDKLRLMHDTLL